MGNQLSNIKGQVYSNSRMKKMHLFLSYGGVNMWNPFKTKLYVPITDISGRLIDGFIDDGNWPDKSDIFSYIEVKFGIKRKWNWGTRTNYLVFDSEEDYLMFILKL
jgi:hypothetical protein